MCEQSTDPHQSEDRLLNKSPFSSLVQHQLPIVQDGSWSWSRSQCCLIWNIITFILMHSHNNLWQMINSKTSTGGVRIKGGWVPINLYIFPGPFKVQKYSHRIQFVACLVWDFCSGTKKLRSAWNIHLEYTCTLYWIHYVLSKIRNRPSVKSSTCHPSFVSIWFHL